MKMKLKEIFEHHVGVEVMRYLDGISYGHNWTDQRGDRLELTLEPTGNKNIPDHEMIWIETDSLTGAGIQTNALSGEVEIGKLSAMAQAFIDGYKFGLEVSNER